MGADFFEDEGTRLENQKAGRIDIGIGRDTVIERAIIDKNARIGPGCVICGHPDRRDEVGDGWWIVDGIVVVPKNAVLPPDTVI